jgi:2-polyprenyl-3-methyl-5-hydroxy-6-metoxy-1,4-benzoquinol methylase
MTEAAAASEREQLMGKVMGEFAGAFSAVLVRVGEQTGLFKALAQGAADSEALAARAGVTERYVREWLAAMAAAGYVAYDPASRAFSLTEAQAALFAQEGTPFYLPPFADLLVGVNNVEPKITAAFKSGQGIPWGERHACLFCGMERCSRSTTAAYLVDQWLPAVPGAVERLTAGAKVADIGCGRGGAVLAMAQRFPKSTVWGFDLHEPSIAHATERAAELGVSNARFAVAAAKGFPGEGYDFITIVDALHDMGDPAGAARHVRQALAPGGAWMVVEPLASDRLEENFNTRGQLAYAASTCICTPVSLSQEVGRALGAQAGETALRAVLAEGGFTDVSRVAETSNNIVLEARR